MEWFLQKDFIEELLPLLHSRAQHCEGLRANICKHLLEFIRQLFPLTLGSSQDQKRGRREEGRQGREKSDLEGLRGHIPPRVHTWKVKDRRCDSLKLSQDLGGRKGNSTYLFGLEQCLGR